MLLKNGESSSEGSWTCMSSPCAYFLREHACLVEPVLLPGVLLLPVVPFDDGFGRQLPPLQGTGSYGVFCHGSCGNASRLKEHPVGCARTIRQHRAAAARRRRKDPRAVCEDCDQGRCSLCRGVCSESWRGKDEALACEATWDAKKVFLIGYRRTGIASTVAALERLGVLPVCVGRGTDYTNCKVVVVRRSFDESDVLETKSADPLEEYNASVAHWWADVDSSDAKAISRWAPVPGTHGYLEAYARYNTDVRRLFSSKHDEHRFLDLVVGGPDATMRRLCTFLDPALLTSPLAAQCLWPFPHKNANCRLHGHEKGRLHGAECGLH